MEPQPTHKSVEDEGAKAQMLITLLGNDFTRNASHPFFRKLTETATKVPVPGERKADISRALENLMGRLASKKTTQVSDAQTDRLPAIHSVALPEFSKDRAVAPSNRKRRLTLSMTEPEPEIATHQHPAVIATTLLNATREQRSEKLKSLSAPVARRVVIYLGELGRAKAG